MSGERWQQKVVVTNPAGLHLRPAAAFAKLAGTFQCTVTVCKEGRRVNGKSLLELTLLAAEQGSELLVEATGAGAAEAVQSLAELLARADWDEEAEPPVPPKG
jgi:phosphotransferase system HPr (HPr) family protein